jgi:hypothetical protein
MFWFERFLLKIEHQPAWSVAMVGFHKTYLESVHG